MGLSRRTQRGPFASSENRTAPFVLGALGFAGIAGGSWAALGGWPPGPWLVLGAGAAAGAFLLGRLLGLRHGEQRYRLVADHAGDIIWTLELASGRITYVSPACERILGFTPEEQSQRMGQLEMLTPASAARAGRLMERAGAGELDQFRFEAEHYTKSGDTVWCEVDMRIVRDSARRAIGVIGVTRDISERKRIERSLRESQVKLRRALRMEAVGQLASGIAHDFNNLLTVVMGNLELADQAAEGRPPLAGFLREARDACQRGASMTKRLLAFSRRQVLRPRPFVLKELIDSMLPILRRTLGESIDLSLQCREDLWPCRADPAETETAVLNLVINARDAMASGGKLELATDHLSVGPAGVADLELAPGDYVVLRVCDSGSGIGREVLDRVYEPFFTTKAEGQGTGLGLSMVYGFVKQSGGYVRIESQVGVGTTVEVFLPRASGPAEVTSREQPDVDPGRGAGRRVLVVEDDPAVRRVVTRMLEQLDYQPTCAEDARSALRALERDPGIEILVTDVVLPHGQDGFELAREAQRRRPAVRTLHVSGYADVEAVRDARLDPQLRLLEKPFSRDALARELDALLGR